MNELLKEYFDKSYIASLLCELSSNYYSFIYSFVMFPTILSSSVLTVLNSSAIDTDTIKYINIILNGINTIILAVNNNLKLNDRIIEFKSKKVKFTVFTHKLESLLNKIKANENVHIDLDAIINEYDSLYNDISYVFPHHIKKKIIKKYGNIKTLPNSLQIEVDIPLKRNMSDTSDKKINNTSDIIEII